MYLQDISIAETIDDTEQESCTSLVFRDLLDFMRPKVTKIVVFGGSNPNTLEVSDRVHVYDVKENRWSTLEKKLKIEHVLSIDSTTILDGGDAVVTGKGRSRYDHVAYIVYPRMLEKCDDLNAAFFKISPQNAEFCTRIAVTSTGVIYGVPDTSDEPPTYYWTGATKKPIPEYGFIPQNTDFRLTAIGNEVVVSKLDRSRPLSTCVTENGGIFISAWKEKQNWKNTFAERKSGGELPQPLAGKLLFKRGFHATVCLNDGLIFIFGDAKECELYDPSSGRTTIMAQMPVALVDFAVATY